MLQVFVGARLIELDRATVALPFESHDRRWFPASLVIESLLLIVCATVGAERPVSFDPVHPRLIVVIQRISAISGKTLVARAGEAGRASDRLTQGQRVSLAREQRFELVHRDGA